MGRYKYGLVLDAGSSGTRLYVYRWLNGNAAQAKADGEKLRQLPEVKTKKKWHKKIRPGLSTYAEKPEEVGEHFKELVDFAMGIVPNDEWEHTRVFVLATAGMRLLPKEQRDAIMGQVCWYFISETKFSMVDCPAQTQTISGETEGLYGWIAVNYLLGGFNAPDKHHHGKGHHTYGFLDMGGASAQIAFAPNATESEKHANDLTLLRLRTVDGQAMDYRVFVTTWLGFGANEARRRYVERLIEVRPGVKEVPDPCLPKGILATQSGEEIAPGAPELDDEAPHLIGTGDFPTCLVKTYPLLEKTKPCDDPPCLLNGIHTPAIDFDVNHFVGISEFWYTTHGIFALAHKNKAYDLRTYQEQVTSFCSRDWKGLEIDAEKGMWGSKIDEKAVEEVCFKASWLINVLHDGLGIPRVGIETSKHTTNNKTLELVDSAKDAGFLDPFQAVDKIDGTEVSWTLGKAVMYAASQMPPADAALPVGFGSTTNETAFETAGGHYHPLPNDFDSDQYDEWHEKILAANYQRRVPGVLIFLLIFGFFFYLLCGRDRRASILHNILSCCGRRSGSIKPKGRKKGLFGGSFFSNSSPTYERVLEAGVDPDEFELSDVEEEKYSDATSMSGRGGRTSGITTPAVRGISPDLPRGSPKGQTYFDATTGQGTSHGLGIAPFERAGLSSRSESKDRVTTRSRKSSPTRKTPLATPFKESLD